MKNGTGGRKFKALLLIQMIILVALAGTILYRNNIVVDVSISDWGSNYIDFDNGWYVDESIMDTQDTIDIICGPYIALKQGTYTVSVEYECDHDQACLVFANGGNEQYLESGLRKLRASEQSILYNFTLTKKIDNFEVVVKYDGQGALEIKNIEIKPDTSDLQSKSVLVLYLFIFIDLCIYFYKRGKKLHILILSEVGIVLFLVAILYVQSRKAGFVEVMITDWNSQYVEYNDKGWYIDDIMSKANERIAEDAQDGMIHLIDGPCIPLKKGTYTVSVEYECDEDQSCFADADYVYDTYIKTGVNKLSKNQTNMSFDFTLTDDIDNFEIAVQYNGQGKLSIENIEIEQNSVGIQRIFAIVILLLVLVNGYLYHRKAIEENRMLVLQICGIILLVSVPLFVRGTYGGHDIGFHLMRVEGLAEELRRGVFPVRLSSLWMDGYGYPASIFYGDIFLYIPAVLRIIGFPIVTAYKSYVFLINIGTVIISYVCFQKIFKSRETALLTTLAYATAGYRMLRIYAHSAVGEYSAMMFFPVITLAVYQFYTMEHEEWKLYKRYAFILALGMSGVIGTHILSTEMVVITLFMVCVVLWKRTFRKNVLRGYMLAAFETIVLNLYFIIPFLAYYLNVEVSVNYAADDIKVIQEQGAYIGQYFSFFQKVLGISDTNLSFRMSLTPGAALMLALVAALIAWVNENPNPPAMLGRIE